MADAAKAEAMKAEATAEVERVAKAARAARASIVEATAVAPKTLLYESTSVEERHATRALQRKAKQQLEAAIASQEAQASAAMARTLDATTTTTTTTT